MSFVVIFCLFSASVIDHQMVLYIMIVMCYQTLSCVVICHMWSSFILCNYFWSTFVITCNLLSIICQFHHSVSHHLLVICHQLSSVIIFFFSSIFNLSSIQAHCLLLLHNPYPTPASTLLGKVRVNFNSLSLSRLVSTEFGHLLLNHL